MRHDRFHASGYPIGSGTAKGPCQRLTAATIRELGMIWMQQDTQAMLALRAELLRNPWDEERRDTRRLRKALRVRPPYALPGPATHRAPQLLVREPET